MSGSLIPNAKQQFLDANGNPLAGGFVYYYIPGTTTFKNTYQNSALTILNTNPIILDSAGECIAYGLGSFRQIVTDVNGNLIWDQPTLSILTNDAINVVYYPPFTNSVSETVQGKLQQSVSILDFIPSSEWGAIYAGTSTYNCSPAMTAALSALTSQIIQSSFYTGSKEIFFPKGKYYFASTINLKQSVILRGEGQFATTQLEFADGIDGIIVNRYDTLGRTTESPTTYGADYSILQNLFISQKSGSSGFGRGVSLRARATLKNVYIIAFKENGVHIVANTGGDEQTLGNANLFYLDDVICANNNGYGFYISGADANAGTCIQCSATNNTKGGFNDNSFLGNTFIGCHTENNGTGTFTVAVSTIVGNPTVTVVDGNISLVKVGMIFTSYGVNNNAPATVISVNSGSNQFTVNVNAYLTSSSTICYFSNFQKSAIATTGSSVVTFSNSSSITNTSLLEAGMSVISNSFSIDTIILSVDSLTQLTLSSTSSTTGNIAINFVYPSYQAEGANTRSVFVGCYAEGGQGATYIGGSSNILGGLHGSGVITTSNTFSIRGSKAEGILNYYSNSSNISGNPHVGIGSNPNNRFINFYSDNDISYGQGFDISDTRSCWNYSNEINALLSMTLNQPTAVHNPSYMYGGRGSFQANQLFIQGFFLGPENDQGRYVTYDSAYPTTGTHAIGEIVFNNAPSAGGFVGWVCTTAGIPGTWKTFGAISA